VPVLVVPVPVDVVEVPVEAVEVPVEAVAPVVPVLPVEPVPDGVAVGVGVAVAVPVALVLPLDEASAEAPLGAGPLGIVTVAGGPGTSGAMGSPPPQPATRSATSRRPSEPTRSPYPLSAEGRTSGGRMWGSR
jgi:hypothetical protein